MSNALRLFIAVFLCVDTWQSTAHVCSTVHSVFGTHV
jgi:hypothetical protein